MRSLESSLAGERAEIERETARLQVLLKEREAALMSLEKALQTLRAEKDTESSSLRGEVEGLRGELDAARTEHAHSRADLQEASARKDAEINRLTSEIQVLENLRLELKQHQATIERLEGELRSQARLKDEALRKLQGVIQEKEAAAAALQERVGQLEPQATP